uniref:DUF2281 domain-containing protein n=1 Tax=Caldilinea aerophila TaxID=133453 RepID=A0A7C1FLA4_9CHLR
MVLDEKIYQYAQKPPRSLQEELLNFIQYLLVKAEQQKSRGGACCLYLPPCTLQPTVSLACARFAAVQARAINDLLAKQSQFYATLAMGYLQ